jgi:hypothetical protein
MTFRTSLARYLRGLLDEPLTPTTSSLPTPNPGSTPPTTTPSTKEPSSTSEAALLAVVLETMKEMQSENLREIRGMVTDLIQGRPMDEATLAAMAAAAPQPPPSRMAYDPPDYDNPGTEDLPGGIQAVFEREQGEQDEMRRLRTESEILSLQLEEARARAGVQFQGPGSEPS